MTTFLKGAFVRKLVVGCLMFTSAVFTQPAFAQDVQTQQSRGDRRPRFHRVDSVRAYDKDVWRIRVTPGAYVRVMVVGDGDTDLDLTVYGGRFHAPLAIADDETDYCVVNFRAPQSGIIEVEIENLGTRWNRYELSVSY